LNRLKSRRDSKEEMTDGQYSDTESGQTEAFYNGKRNLLMQRRSNEAYPSGQI